jgi:flagellar biosynthesis/type III secretory pathway chaperone
MDQDARRRLEDVLDREIEAARSLAATLAAERRALTGDTPKAIQETAADKLQILGAIERLETERRGLWALPSAQALAATIAERWRTLMELMAGCRTLNEINGHIIRVRQHQVGQLMDIVRGGPAITYGPQGKTYAKALRALARA